jgi:hypothetical protein
MSIKVLVTTGCGNTVQGGADIWTNYFLELVWPTLPDKRSWRLLIDSKRPAAFESKYLPSGLIHHFHYDDPEKTRDWLDNCDEIHVLHPHYHNRPHIWHFEDKFKTVFVHAYAREMDDAINAIPELKRLQYNTEVDAEFYDEYLATFNRRIWVGCNTTNMIEEHPNYTYNIPNFYEFKHNIELTTNINNGKIGYAARSESRKCLHWLNEYHCVVLTNQHDVLNLKDSTTYTFKQIDLFQWDPKILHFFMLKNWGIFHGAYFKEPFGYSIFQAVDYGKLPILNSDWMPEIEYKYRVSTKNEFDECIKQILNDSHEERLYWWNKLKDFMQKYNNKEEWIDKIRTAILA